MAGIARALTVQNAEIATANVEIKSLTVSGKQVTLAVFRQVQDEDLIDDEGNLRGVPWGRINYHPDKCADDHNPHWHVLWQTGRELRRAYVSQKPKWGYFGTKTGDLAFRCYCRDFLLSKVNSVSIPLDELNSYRYPRDKLRIVREGVRIELLADEDLAVVVRNKANDWRRSERESFIASCGDHSFAGLWSEFIAEVDVEMRRRSKIEKSISAVGDLPQLFIAV